MPEMIVDTEQLKRVAVELSEYPKVAPKAMAAALNRTITTVKTEMKREAVAAYEIKAGDVNKTLSIKRASPSKLQAVASSVGRPIALIHFKVKPKKPPTKATRKRVMVKIKKSSGYSTINTKPSAFVQNASGAINVFQRKGAARLPIKRLYSLAVPQMIGSKAVMDRIQVKANETLDKRVTHEIEYRLGKIKGGNE